MLPSMDHPEKLYKFRSLVGDSGRHVGRTLFEGEVYFGSSRRFNDPFECLPAYVLEGTAAQKTQYFKPFVSEVKDVPQEHVHELSAHLASQPDTLNMQKLQDTFKSQMDAFPMHCLSAVADNVLMWSHYAAEHSGVCLEFDGKCPIFEEATAVTYSSERVRINVIDDKYISRDVLLTKSLDWHYEQEWRLIEVGTSPGVRIWPPAALSAIILGARISEADRARVMAWVTRRSPKIAVRQASMSTKRFKVDIRDVT